jgi:outer membrane autotransporter protein
LNDTFSVDFSVGYSDISIDQFRTLGTTRITSSVDAERWFVAGNLNAGRQIDNWYLSARAGLLYAKESQDGFTESNGTISSARTFQIGQFRAGGDVSYSWDSFEPFANLTYEYDYSRDDIIVAAGIPQPANDNDDFLVGAGLRWFGESGVSASFEWNSVLGREDFSDDTFSLLLRGDF